MKIELSLWMNLCFLSDFERWHDNKFGNPIIGKAPQHNKNTDASSSEYGGASSTSSGGCYVATAIYGSYDCLEVWTLRRFRDLYLSQSWYGRAFIRIYYATSPTLVKFFGETGWFKHFWKNQLDKWVISLKRKGYSDRPYNDDL